MLVLCLYIPDSRVVRPESHHKVSLRVRHESVPPHRRGRELGMVARVIESSICFRSPDDLEVVPVQMEWVFASIVVVQDDLNDLALFKDESVRVSTVYYGV